MSSPMTLREAVEIDRLAHVHEGGVRRNGRDYEPTDEEVRARAIVDAAVEFVEARAELVRVESLIPYNGANVVKAFDVQRKCEEKLRDLQRGQTQQQPKESP